MLGATREARFGAPPRRHEPERAGVSQSGVLPYDFAATFRITGRPGNLVQDVINISTDGSFVATAIGYGFEEDRERLIVDQATLKSLVGSEPVVVGDLELRDLPLGALIEGFRVNPRFASWIFGGSAGDQGFDGSAGFGVVPADRVFGNVLQRIKKPQELSFLFSMVDTGTGREFQDQPAHNLSSLGKSNGERPFRMLAQPFHFAPRSTLRLQITERTEGVTGTLFIVLYGYRLLGTGICPEPVVRRLAGPKMCPTETIGNPNSRIIPFDYVAQLELTGRRGNQLEQELPVDTAGGFIATSIGYGLAVEERRVRMQLESAAEIQDAELRAVIETWKPGTLIDLGRLPLRLFPQQALLDGVRIRPEWIRIALRDNGALADKLPFELLDSIFERLNRPEDVAFRYAFFDTGTGRELQNQRLNNIAGLGVADGDRPFKRLSRPMIFLPRSAIRVEVEEVFGRGSLFVAFQGYKLLDPQAANRGAKR